MAEDKKQEDEELKVTEQQDGSVTIGDEPPHEEPEDDERLSASDDSEEGEDADHPDDSEEKRERNRKRRAEAKEKRKSYIDGLKREIEMERTARRQMEERLNVVERKSTGSEMAQLSKAEADAVQAYNHFKQLNAQAIEQANGAVAIDAQEKMFEARKRYEQIQGVKRAMTQRQQAPQPLDPRLLSHAEQWMGQNKWYDPNGKDEDSSIVLTLDDRLAKEGWDPTTPEYWQELQSRVKKYLPHRANSGYNKPQGNRSSPPVTGSGRESSGSTASTYRLSPERVQALKDSGMWDDPKKRAEAVKRYQQYDKEQRV